MRKIALLLLLGALLGLTASAEDIVDTSGVAAAVPDGVSDALDGMTAADADFGEGVQGILDDLSEKSGGALRAAVGTAAQLLAIVLLCALVGHFAPDAPVDAVTLAGVLAVTAACAGSLHSLLRLGSETLDQVRVFANVLLPAMTAATAATGAVSGAAALSGATVLFSDLLINLTDRLLLPLVYAYLALRAADAAVGGESLGRLAGLVSWIITNSLKWLVLGYIAYVSVTGVISGSADSAKIRAAKLANADGFIRHLPEGYQTMLTGDGANLSQGQRQLLAIARAAVADPPVLILDEATSSIDTRTERIVQDGMDKLMKGRTTFVIAHRLSTVRNADCIMVLEQGRIIERGTHDQLIDEKGRYYQLYTGNAIAE